MIISEIMNQFHQFSGIAFNAQVYLMSIERSRQKTEFFEIFRKFPSDNLTVLPLCAQGVYFTNIYNVTSTVKLGYNELGYNEHSVITNEYFGPKSQFST